MQSDQWFSVLTPEDHHGDGACNGRRGNPAVKRPPKSNLHWPEIVPGTRHWKTTTHYDSKGMGLQLTVCLRVLGARVLLVREERLLLRGRSLVGREDELLVAFGAGGRCGRGC